MNIDKSRLVWCDAVRLLAFVMLLCCHAADPFNAAATYAASADAVDPELVSWGVIWGSLVRPCVPLFVMLTGVLSLPVRTPMGDFYKRRIPRVLYPFAIWSAVYYLTPWLTGVLGLERSVVTKLFCWAESDSQSLSDGLAHVARIPYAFSFIACHMWYIYMLIGLYLYLPIFSAWVECATRRQKEMVLLFWGVSILLPYFNEFVSRYAFGTCEWNPYGMFYYFAGFNGYMLLGHYVQQYVQISFKKTLCASLPLLAIGFWITYSGFSYIMQLPEKTPEQIELFWTYNTPNVAMMSLACFLLMKHVNPCEKSRAAAWLANLTTCGFGIYMIHYYFVYLGYDLGQMLGIPSPLRIPSSAIIILACSWSIIALIKHLWPRRSTIFVG